MSQVAIELPYPPSVNHYWRRVGVRTIVSEAGRLYQAAVKEVVTFENAAAEFDGPLDVMVELYPPDARERDLDNVLKALLDSMANAKVYLKDSQIVSIRMCKQDPLRPDGMVYVEVSEYRPRQDPTAYYRYEES